MYVMLHNSNNIFIFTYLEGKSHIEKFKFLFRLIDMKRNALRYMDISAI